MYAAEIAGQRLTFEAEAVWRRNMIMRDRETGTLWQHSTGEGLIGPLAKHSLNLLPSQRLTAKGWLEDHPHSTISKSPDEWPGLLPLSWTLTALEKATASGRVPGQNETDHRLDQNQEVIGVTHNNEAKAYPLEALKPRELLIDEVGGVRIGLVHWDRRQEVRVYRMPIKVGESTVDHERSQLLLDGARWDIDGRPEKASMPSLELINHKRVWWSGWFEFYPDTEVFRSED